MDSFTRSIYATLGRHFVSLSCTQTAPATARRTLVFSGFLVDVSCMWFYVTAGHIVRDVRSALTAGALFEGWRLSDATAGKGLMAIPYDFIAERWLLIEDASSGLDYAAVLLEEFYCKQLAAGGAVPIGKEAWGDHVTDYDRWALAGMPSETVKPITEGTILTRFMVAPLVEAEEPATANDKTVNQFYARLPPASASYVKDIDGMSGGPVFAFKKLKGTWKYKVIGIQSGWYRQSRIVAVCPFSSFGYALEELVKEAVAVQLNSGESAA